MNIYLRRIDFTVQPQGNLKNPTLQNSPFLVKPSITFLTRNSGWAPWISALAVPHGRLFDYSCACQGDKGVFYPFHWPSISKEGFSLSLKTPTSNRTLLIKDFKIFVSYHNEWEYDFLILHYLYRGYIYLPLSTASHENSDGKNLPPYCFPCKTTGSHRSIRRPDFFGSEHLISLIT